MTTLLDPQRAPALELAALYRERWEIESVFDEFKTNLRANSTVMRSKTPELVQQELWGLLLAHSSSGHLPLDRGALREAASSSCWARSIAGAGKAGVAPRKFGLRVASISTLPVKPPLAGSRKEVMVPATICTSVLASQRVDTAQIT